MRLGVALDFDDVGLSANQPISHPSFLPHPHTSIHRSKRERASEGREMAGAAAAFPLRSFTLPNHIRLAIGVGDITKVWIDSS